MPDCFSKHLAKCNPNSSPSPSTISCKFSGVPFFPTFHQPPFGGEAEAHLAFLQFRTEAFHGLKKGRFRQQKFWMFPIVILISPGSLKLPLKIYHPKRRGLSSNHPFFRGELLNFGRVSAILVKIGMNINLVVEPTHFKKICSSKIDHLQQVRAKIKKNV